MSLITDERTCRTGGAYVSHRKNMLMLKAAKYFLHPVSRVLRKELHGNTKTPWTCRFASFSSHQADEECSCSGEIRCPAFSTWCPDVIKCSEFYWPTHPLCPDVRMKQRPADTGFGCFVTSHGFPVFILRLPKSEAYCVSVSRKLKNSAPSIPYAFFHIHSLPSLSLFTIAIHSQCQFQLYYSYHCLTMRNIIYFLIDFCPWLFVHFTTGFGIRSPSISTQGFAHVKGVLVTGIVTSHSTLGFLSWFTFKMCNNTGRLGKAVRSTCVYSSSANSSCKFLHSCDML